MRVEIGAGKLVLGPENGRWNEKFGNHDLSVVSVIFALFRHWVISIFVCSNS